MKKTSSSKSGYTPRSKLGPAGKTRPPKIEKLTGNELPPPDRPKNESPAD